MNINKYAGASLIAFSFFVFQIIACDNVKTKTEIADSTNNSSGVDSMPVVKMPITDSSSIIITPPVNDSNVKIPDTSNRKR